MPPNLTYSSPLLGLFVTLGNLAIWLGLASAITCVVLYWTSMIRAMRRPVEATEEANGGAKKGGRKTRDEERALSEADRKTERIGLWGRRFFYLTSAFVVLGCVSLMVLVLNQQYTVHYIWKNSNSHLPFGYRFASFWSDQEGTFFLWALYNVVFGAVLLWKARADERWVMPFFTLIHVSLLTLLTFMNPFWLHPAHEVRQLLESIPNAPKDVASFLPATLGQHIAYYFGWATYVSPKLMDGRGLNESLQNFWMVIHPPTLFVGFSSMVIPGCFALGALMKRDYDTWAHRASPWLMFSWTVLAVGIFMGAYWAYETLGWGGYWSWDPVENASLLPWLAGTTLLHGLLAQRNRGNLKQANLFLGVMTAVCVLLSSFMNRSGVLSEVSVHSFATPQAGVFWTLLGILAIWFAMSVGIWFWRFKDIQSEIAYEHVWERHFGFFLGLVILSAMTAALTAGITAPIWYKALGKTSNIDYTWYNKVMLPSAFAVMLLMALTPLMPWRKVRDDAKPPRPFSIAMIALCGVCTLFFLFAAVYAWQGGFKLQNDPAYLAFGMVLALALVTNGVCGVRAARGGLLNTGPWLAHIGFIVTMAGVLITSRFNTVHPIERLDQGESVAYMGYTFTFKGEQLAKDPTDRDHMLIDMEKNGHVWHLNPKAFISTQMEKPQPMAWPQIVHDWWGGAWGDIYIEPSRPVGRAGLGVFPPVKKGAAAPEMTTVQLRKTDPEDVVGLTLVDFDTSAIRDASKRAPGEPPILYANVLLNVNGMERKVRAGLRVTDAGMEPIPVPVPGLRQSSGYALLFRELQPGTFTGSFALVPGEEIQSASFQVLHVPGIQVLWWGCYIMFFGGFLCFRRRTKLANQPVAVKQRGGRAEAEVPERVRTPDTGTAPAGAE
jgi:cytochrome c-type biogenesis protein CcmF